MFHCFPVLVCILWIVLADSAAGHWGGEGNIPAVEAKSGHHVSGSQEETSGGDADATGLLLVFLFMLWLLLLCRPLPTKVNMSQLALNGWIWSLTAKYWSGNHLSLSTELTSMEHMIMMIYISAISALFDHQAAVADFKDAHIWPSWVGLMLMPTSGSTQPERRPKILCFGGISSIQ